MKKRPPPLSLQQIVIGVAVALLGSGGGVLESHRQSAIEVERSAKEAARSELRMERAEDNLQKLADWINHKDEVTLLGPPSPYE